MANKYLSQDIINKLNYAYHHEVSNALFYDYIASNLNVLGFINLSDYWEDWSKEERKHSKWVKEFMQELDVRLSPAQLEPYTYNLDASLVEFINITLDREDKTTELYQEILDEGLDFPQGGFLVQFANKMLIEQQEETDKINTIKAKILNIGGNKGLMQIFDNDFED